jgi:hypothetical protein
MRMHGPQGLKSLQQEVEEGETLAVPNVDPQEIRNFRIRSTRFPEVELMLQYLLVQPRSLGGLPRHCRMHKSKLELQRHLFG